MNEQSSFEIFQKQREYLDKLQQSQPELFLAEHVFTEEDALPKISITILPKDRPEGYIRLYPQDFVVEEVRQDKSLSAVEPKDNIPKEPEAKKFTLYADLVKVGISSIEAIKRLADKLKISPNKIGYAGIKDAQALTSQRIALPKIRFEEIKDLKFESFFLTDFFYDKGNLETGDLFGNRFTIFVRTEKEIKIGWLKEKLTQIKNNGFLNFYQTQRFGSKKLMSHILGRLILQEKYEETIKEFLTTPSYYDIKLVKDIRLKAKEYYGSWQKMKQVFLELPYTFQNEIRVLNYLTRDPKNFIGALINLEDQTTLWVYAYMSLLFNKYLSKNHKNLPQELPLALSQDPADRKPYQEWVEQDNIKNIEKALEPFQFIRIKKRVVPTRIFPEKIIGMTTSQGVICSFILPKAAYATTFLVNLFKIRQGLPLPEWLQTTECDTKKFLKIGTIAPAVKILKNYIFSALDNPENLKGLNITN